MVLLIPVAPNLIFLRLLGSTTHLMHLGRLEFGDDRYTWKRLLNHIDDDSFDHGGTRRLHCPHFLPRLLCPTFELSLGQTFPGIALATIRFAGLPRADLESAAEV